MRASQLESDSNAALVVRNRARGAVNREVMHILRSRAVSNAALLRQTKEVTDAFPTGRND